MRMQLDRFGCARPFAVALSYPARRRQRLMRRPLGTERTPRALARMATRAMALRYTGTYKKGTCGLTRGEHYTKSFPLADTMHCAVKPKRFLETALSHS